MNTLNFAMFLEAAARSVPDAPFVHSGSISRTYAETDLLARRYANLLSHHGVKRGDMVMMLLPNSFEFISAQFGILKCGAVPVPLNPQTPAPELLRYLNDSGSVALFALPSSFESAAVAYSEAPACKHLMILDTEDKEREHGESFHPDLPDISNEFESVDTRPEEPALILYTAGTTGQPKGVVLTHFNMYYQATVVQRDFWEVDSTDVVLMIAPGTHIFGQTLMYVAMSAHARLVLMERFVPNIFLETVQNTGVTFFAGVPALAHFLLNSPVVEQYDLKSLSHVMLGGAPVPPEIISRLSEKFGITVITGYGFTEGVPPCYLNERMMKDAPIGTVGLPAFGTDVRIVDEEDVELPRGEIGEIVVRGPMMFREYHGLPETTDEALRNGWFHSGDLGKQDEHGYVYIVDRLKDMIKTSGYAVYPAEVERVLINHPAVIEAAVIGVPHDAVGEIVKGLVTIRPDQEVSPRELISYCKTQLAPYKCPRRIEIRDALPKSPSGKILRRLLKGDAA